MHWWWATSNSNRGSCRVAVWGRRWWTRFSFLWINTLSLPSIGLFAIASSRSSFVPVRLFVCVSVHACVCVCILDGGSTRRDVIEANKKRIQIRKRQTKWFQCKGNAFLGRKPKQTSLRHLVFGNQGRSCLFLLCSVPIWNFQREKP